MCHFASLKSLSYEVNVDHEENSFIFEKTTNMTDVDKWIEIAKRCKYLPEDDLRELCNIVCDLLLEEPNVQPVQTPVTVCGDIHGQVNNKFEILLVYIYIFK